MSEFRLLIIDDNAVSRETLADMLTVSGYEIHQAASGITGIELATKLNPDVILLDVMMPEMDGFEVCRLIRQNPQTAEIPIIMVTALDDRDSRLTGLEAGADDFLSKPFDSLELKIRLNAMKQVARYRHLVEERTKLHELNLLLQKRNLELKTLSAKVIDIQENERRKLAMDLHDEIGQQLTALKLVLENLSSENDGDFLANHHKALTLINDLLQEVRELALDLRPSILDDLGLIASLDWLFNKFNLQTNIKVIHNLRPTEETRFPGFIETAAFRFVQEALTNIAKHAQVSEAVVTLEIDPKYLQVSVLDSGKGFSIDHIIPGTSTGISGMRERVTCAGGSFNIQSAPGEGTMVQATFPLAEEEKNDN